MTGLEYLGRTLADSKDRASWLTVHDSVIGASTAAGFAKPESVEKYIAAMLKPRTFSGNRMTDSGNRREPWLLAWMGYEPNSLFIHAPESRRFGATPDGSNVVNGDLRLAEVKTKHSRVVTGPTPAEVRQVAWQLFCVPEAVAVDWTWGEFVPDGDDWMMRRDPLTLTYTRDHEQIIAATALIIPIAHAVLEGLDAARALAKEVAF